MEYDLSKPAFGPGSETPEGAETKPEEEAVSDAGANGTEPESIDVDEGQPVKYNRFKKVNERAIEAEREAAYWRGVAESRQEVESKKEETDVPDYWKELYGDSEASQKAWTIQQRRDEEVQTRAEQRALEAVRNERHEEVARTEANLQTIDEGFENLSTILGRDLTAKEQSAILDAVDFLTPKDEQGNYAGPLVSFEAALEYAELKNQVGKAPRNASRDAVASLTGSRSQGEPVISEKDKNFNPSWGSLGAAIKERLG